MQYHKPLTHFKLFIFFYFSLLFNFANAQENDTIPHIYWGIPNQKSCSKQFNNAKRINTYAYFQQDQLKIFMKGKRKMPFKLRKIKIFTDENKVKLKSNHIYCNAYNEIKKDSVVTQDSSISFTYPKSINYLKRAILSEEVKDYFEGNSTHPFFYKQYHEGVDTQEIKSHNLTEMHLKKCLFAKAKYRFIKIPVNEVAHLPIVGPKQCGDIGNNIGIMGYKFKEISIKPYSPEKYKYLVDELVIYFRQSQIQPYLADLSEIIKYIQDDDYEIFNVRIKGFASIEGNEELNDRLQRKRADAFSSRLDELNKNHKIENVSSYVSKDYKDFRDRIDSTEFKWLISLNDEELQDTINSNAELLQNLEEYLAPDRKAICQLRLRKELDFNAYYNNALKDLSRWAKKINLGDYGFDERQDIESAVISIINYLFKLQKSGQISQTKFHNDILESGNRHLMHSYLCYYFQVINFNSKGKIPQSWDIFFNQNSIHNCFIKFQKDIINRNQNFNLDYKKELLPKLTDIQLFTYKQTLKNKMDTVSLCEFATLYRSQKTLLPNYRYHLLFLKDLRSSMNSFELACLRSTTNNFYSNTVEKNRNKKYQYTHPIPLEVEPITNNEDNVIQNKKDTTHENESKTDSKMLTNNKLLKKEESFFTSKQQLYRRNSKKTKFDLNIELLQSIILNEDMEIDPKYIWKTFPNYNLESLEFDLYSILNYNIEYWSPVYNFFPDPDLGIHNYDYLINKLKEIRIYLCDWQLNQLLLNYHHKSLIYYQRYGVPGERFYTDLIKSSISFITNYYLDRAKYIDSDLSIYLLNQYNAWYDLPIARTFMYYGPRLLDEIAKERTLSDAEQEYLKQYRR